MRIQLLITFYIIVASNVVISQSSPFVSFEDHSIQDVFIQDNKAYYATQSDLVVIDENNNKGYIEQRHFSDICLDGKYFESTDGWTYLGWQYLDVDLLLPILLVKQYEGSSLIDLSIDISQENDGFFRCATYQSNESIYGLLYNYENHKLLTLNTDSEILNSIDIDLPELKDMIHLEDDKNLIIGEDQLYTFDSNGMVDSKSFSGKIIDVNYYQDQKIEVLTEKNIFWLDNSLITLEIIDLPQNSRFPSSFYSSNDITYLVENEDNLSYISTIDNQGNTSLIFIEIENVIYQEIYISENRFSLWGRNACPFADHIIKLDIDAVDFVIPTMDIGIDELIVKHDKNTIDTIIDGNDIITFTNSHFSWDMTVTNYSGNSINQYYITSSTVDFGSQSYISFPEENPLSSGESREYTGTFKITNIDNEKLNFYTWINSDKVDQNCSNNVVYTETTLSNSNLENIDIVLYPNPAQNEIWINSPSDFSYTLYDSIGKFVSSKIKPKERNIDITSLAIGMYYLQISIDEILIVKKFIKN